MRFGEPAHIETTLMGPSDGQWIRSPRTRSKGVTKKTQNPREQLSVNCLYKVSVRLQANLVPYPTTTAEDPALQFRYNPGDDFCDPDIGKRLC
jgi:hypothetical protein